MKQSFENLNLYSFIIQKIEMSLFLFSVLKYKWFLFAFIPYNEFFLSSRSKCNYRLFYSIGIFVHTCINMKKKIDIVFDSV